MKKGKTSRLNILPKAKCFYGTVDSKNLKSIYIVLQCWVEPLLELDNWDRVIGNLERQIKHTVLESIDQIVFNRNTIVDLDLRSSGVMIGKRSFLNLEITLFVKKEMEFKSPILKDRVKQLVTIIYNFDICKSKYFMIHKSKSSKIIS